MNYPPNARQWRKGDYVLHDADHKSARMLMIVTKDTDDDGTTSTRYASSADGRGRRVMQNHYSVLHAPSLFNVEAPVKR